MSLSSNRLRSTWKFQAETRGPKKFFFFRNSSRRAMTVPYLQSLSLRTVRFGFSEDDWQSLVRLSKEVLHSNLPKSKKYWSAGHHMTRYLGRCLTPCSGITQPWFLSIRRGVKSYRLNMGSDTVAKDFQHSNIFDLFQVSFGEKIDFWLQTCIVCHFELMGNFWMQINILNKISANLITAFVDGLRQSLSVLSCASTVPSHSLKLSLNSKCIT